MKNTKELIQNELDISYGFRLDDYRFKIDNDIVDSATFILFDQEIKKGLYKSVTTDNNQYALLSKEFIDRLNPDIIGSNIFWKEINDRFPLVSISGKPAKDKNEVNKNALNMHLDNKNISLIDDMFKAFEYPKFLEIGPGYGSIFNYIKSKYKKKRTSGYYTIDVHPLFKYNKMFKTDGGNIPDQVPNNLDLIFSFNVFQHVGKNQRSNYYRQAHDKLKTGGIFAFDMFTVVKENENIPRLWGYRDEEDNRYAYMLRQLTYCDRAEETVKELLSIGFKVLVANVSYPNHGKFICQKIN